LIIENWKKEGMGLWDWEEDEDEGEVKETVP
jgi:hypothetical protein